MVAAAAVLWLPFYGCRPMVAVLWLPSYGIHSKPNGCLFVHKAQCFCTPRSFCWSCCVRAIQYGLCMCNAVCSGLLSFIVGVTQAHAHTHTFEACCICAGACLCPENKNVWGPRAGIILSCMYVCLFVRRHACMYVSRYVLCVSMCAYVRQYVCLYVCLSVCMYVKVYVCISEVWQCYGRSIRTYCVAVAFSFVFTCSIGMLDMPKFIRKRRYRCAWHDEWNRLYHTIGISVS